MHSVRERQSSDYNRTVRSAVTYRRFIERNGIDMNERIVIVGAGHSAGVAVASLREHGYVGEIVVVGEEAHAPYQRPPLSKNFLAGQMSVEQLQLKPAKFYDERAVQFRLNTRVNRIDRERRELSLGGESLSYSKLLLATGSRPRQLDVPGATLPGVHYLRTIADVAAIRAEMSPGKRLVVVGGGYIGLEAAAIAVKAGLQVTVLEAAGRILSRVSGPPTAEFFVGEHARQGVEIRCDAGVQAIEGADRVNAVVSSQGGVAADLVIVGVGVEPNVELAAAAGLACDNGIVVDEFTRTADENIHAAGDCTNHPNKLLDRRLRLESVQNAVDQARAAASNMCGKALAYSELPWFWSNQYDLRLQIAGLSQGHDEAVMRGDPAARTFSVMYLRGGKLIAADTVSAPREHLAFRKLIAAGGEVDIAKLADTSVPLT
jgi:3-phenylpropionate/trans-cinnamate dioxygenase ferredoxin reductase component